MPGTTRRNAATIFVGLGLALFGGSFVIGIAGMRSAGIVLIALGLIIWLSARKQSKGPEA
jgi:hypothetical protein